MADSNPNKPTLNRELLCFIFSNITISQVHFYKGDPCWEWPHINSSTGYGNIWFPSQRQPELAHRFLYTLFVGDIGAKLHCDHLCRVRHCVNPAHIEPVTQKENLLRGNGATARNARKTHCKHGHPFAGENLILLKTGGRTCRACLRAKHLRRYYRIQALPPDDPRRTRRKQQQQKASAAHEEKRKLYPHDHPRNVQKRRLARNAYYRKKGQCDKMEPAS